MFYAGHALRSQQRAPRVNVWPKVCSGCNVNYDKAQWQTLETRGIQQDAQDPLELRNCTACGSTLAVLAQARDSLAHDEWQEIERLKTLILFVRSALTNPKIAAVERVDSALRLIGAELKEKPDADR